METGRLEETLCSLSSRLPYFQSFNSSADQKHKFNIETCLGVNLRIYFGQIRFASSVPEGRKVYSMRRTRPQAPEGRQVYLFKGY